MAEAPGNVSCQPYWLKTPDTYLVDQARMYHNDAVYALGEYSMFILLWGITDYQAGTVQRCPYCYDRADTTGVDAQISAVYGQPALANHVLQGGGGKPGRAEGQARPPVHVDQLRRDPQA
jgi:hypothetical protein